MTVVVPGYILSRPGAIWSGADGAFVWSARAAGILLLCAGLGLFAWCVALFARVGNGTLAPWDPTQALVAVGPYRVVRNPMITGVALVLAGESLLFGSRILGTWTFVFVMINHVYFIALEEPGLRRRFGASYREYAETVPRWLPRIRRGQ